MRDKEWDLKKPNKILMEFCRNNNIACLDTLKYFKEESLNNILYIEDGAHMNKKGHELAASLIYESLINGKMLRER